MWYKHSFGFYELFWLSEKWIALSQVIRGKGNQIWIKEHEVCVQDLQSNLLYLQIFNFQVNPGISRVGINAVTYRMDIKWSWNVPLTIWFDSGSSGNLKIIPILAELMIALTSLFHANSNKTNNIQSDHQHSVEQKRGNINSGSYHYSEKGCGIVSHASGNYYPLFLSFWSMRLTSNALI